MEVTSQSEPSSEIIPNERRIAWNPGVPGGIPKTTGPVKNILDFGADPTGKSDSHNAITQAINALPSDGGVVYIPEGTFLVKSKISITRSKVVIRGAGWKSKLLFESNGDCIEVITYQRGTWQSLPVGASKNSLVLTVEDGTLFTPGKFAEIEQENDADLMYTDPDWIVSWAEQSVGQLFEVESVMSNEVTFTTPVNYNFSTELNARVRPQGFITHVGLEDFYIEKLVAADHTIIFKNAAYCWVRNIESNHTRRTHVHQTSCLGNEIRDSYFHRSFSYGGGGSGYGVECGFHVTGCLVENNIFDSLRHAMIIQVGANGNVYGYNYSIHSVQGEGESNLNIGWDPPDISIHGHYPFMNLFEGNEVVEIGIGDYWGPAGPGNTYFRNRVTGEGIVYHDASHQQNLVGNVTTRFKDDKGPALEKLEHGNVVNGTVSWDPDITSHDLPDSYYLDSIPGFFEDQTLPLFGPDLAGESKLPAQLRFENLPYLDVTAEAETVGTYEKLEFTIDNGKSYNNPYDPLEADINGEFISPTSDTLRINAFWDGRAWKLRFAGAETGQWSYTIKVSDREGTDKKTGTFHLTESGQHGWIGPSESDPHYLQLHDGTPFFGIGMAVPWLVYDNRYYEQPDLLTALASYRVNFINWLFTSWDILLIRDSYNSYSMEDAEAFDLLLEDAEQQEIKLLLGIWIHDLLRDTPHPWSGFYDWKSNPFNQLTTVDEFFSDSTSWAWQEKYYRYIIARWGYSSSIGMWHTVAEINGTNAIYDPLAMTNDEQGWHNKINSYFRDNDPFNHPTTVSGSGGYDFTEGWQVTDAPQVHEYPWPPENLKQNPDRIAHWSDKLFNDFNKPNLVGEFGKARYEEGKSESFLHNGIWAGVMSGVCVTPLHWWGGQIAARPENFSTFNETMLNQLKYLDGFISDVPMAAHQFSPLYSAPAEKKPTLTGMTDGEVYGLKGDSLHLLWIYQVDENSDQIFNGVQLTFPGVTNGWYLVSFYNTWSGEWYRDTLDVECSNGILDFPCPDFTGDLAIRIDYHGPRLPNGMSHLAHPSVKIYPNPCQSLVYVESFEQIFSARLLSLTGQVLLTRQVPMTGQSGRQNRFHLDLSDLLPGLFILEIRDTHGLVKTTRLEHY
jgi:hypothetical protein